MKEDIHKIAKETASLIHKNIRDVVAALTINIEHDKAHTILAAFAAVYSVESFFEFKLGELGFDKQAMLKAKEGADKYVNDVISSELGGFSIDKKGEA